MAFDFVVRQINYVVMKKPCCFAPIIFLQGEPALPILKLWVEGKADKAIACLQDFETGDEHVRLEDFDLTRPWGRGDTTCRRGDYVIAVNEKLQYVSLSKRFNPRGTCAAK